MNRNMLRRSITTLLTGLLLATGATAQEVAEPKQPESDQQQPSRDWTLRFGLLVADTTGDTSVTVEPGSVNVNISGGAGAFVSFERRVTPLIGIEFGMSGMSSDISLSAGPGHKHHSSDVDLLAMGTLTLGMNFHFVDDGPVDVYAGPLLAYNSYAGLSISAGIDDDWWTLLKHDGCTSVSTRSDSEVSWGARAGLHVFLTEKKRWSLGASLTYLDASYDFERHSEPGSTSISLDPLMFSFGAGFRF